MLTYLNRLFHKQRQIMSGKGGQVAVILILVTAAALIFYAVSLNLGRMSQTKTMTTIASDTGASLLASYMASKGQAIFQTTLGGRTKICAWTGIFAAILAIIIIIIACVATACTAAPAVLVGLSMLEIALVLAVVALVIQVAVIQPGLNEMWNDKIWHSMEEKDAFVEQGIQKGLSSAVSDNVLVFDADDADMDRIWGPDPADGVTPLDRINRFGFYYNRRLDAAAPVPAVPVVTFTNALSEFLKEGGDGWGIYDENGPNCSPFAANSECNPCCVPATDSDGNQIRLTNLDCDPFNDPDDETYVRNTVCGANSPYGAAYPWVYDAFRENPTNAFVSLREALGRDDEHRGFAKNPADPNNVQISEPDPACVAVCAGDLACEARCQPAFKLKDTTGFYTPPVYPLNDNRTGSFPFFYKIADWKVNLEESFDLVNKPYQCHWCDQDDLTSGSGMVGPCPADQPLEAPQLVLPLNPATLTYNTTYCVDGANPNPGWPPLAVDLVRLPDPNIVPFVGNPAIGKIIADNDQCAQNVVGDPDTGFWKRGGDRFCSSGDYWPYFGNGCSKWGTCDITTQECACGDAGTASADSWPDDMLDDLVYGLNDFILWAEDMLGKSSSYLVKEFKNWYPSAADWIEEGTDSGANNAATCTQCCFVCAAEDGGLWAWYKEIREMRTRLQAWRDTSFASAPGVCREVWCIPDPAGCAGVPSPPVPEAATFDYNDTNGDSIPDAPNGIQGDIEDVVNCINWNANDTVNFSDATSATGNAQKFQACADACDAGGAMAPEKCSDLPRSLVPGVDTSIPDQSGLQRLQGCLSSCNNSNCQSMNPSYFLPSPPLPGDPSLVDFEATQCGTWGVGNVWYDRIMAVLANLCQDPWLQGIRDSIPEAQNQVAKFRQRYNYLSGRLNELNGIISILQAAEDKFYQFLTCEDLNPADGQPDGPACQLIRARIDAEDAPTGLPYHAIYAWQSEPEKGALLGSGRWHIVRVDARIPGKCDRACGVSQDVGSDPGWPRVRTYTKNWGTKRCYELDNTDGVVKMRVTRFDEAGTFGTLLFPNAVEIWQPRFSRPDRPTANADGIEAACLSSMVPDPGQASAVVGSYYYGAFILNERDMMNGTCWDLVNGLLASGVTSEACAQYYYHSGTSPGLGFKFVPCKAF